MKESETASALVAARAAIRVITQEGRQACKLLREIVEITDSDDHRPLEHAVECARQWLRKGRKWSGRK
jgi:hypothetical protein